MATDREIRRRIRSVRNIAKVTRAMEAVSASKMRRAQAQVEATRPYAAKAWEVLTFLANLRRSRADLQPLLQVRGMQRVILLLITADRGLAGGLNSTVISHAWRHIKQWQDEGKEVSLVTVGRKGRDWMARYGPPLRATMNRTALSLKSSSTRYWTGNRARPVTSRSPGGSRIRAVGG